MKPGRPGAGFADAPSAAPPSYIVCLEAKLLGAGEVVNRKPATEADCFIRCPDCGGLVDIRERGPSV